MVIGESRKDLASKKDLVCRAELVSISKSPDHNIKNLELAAISLTLRLGNTGSLYQGMDLKNQWPDHHELDRERRRIIPFDFQRTSLAGLALDSATSSGLGRAPALQCRTPSRHHLELQDRRDYTPADRAARTCWKKGKITRAPRERETRTHLKKVSPLRGPRWSDSSLETPWKEDAEQLRYAPPHWSCIGYYGMGRYWISLSHSSSTHCRKHVVQDAQRLTQVTPPAATPDPLWQHVKAALPNEHIQSLFESMPRRVAAVISNNGGYSGY
ncbi:hypothetical protein TNCV_1747121 [Trichonephila clavipes]|nr:hypothetical protein TNCV_1747121 [Trichonephila clavipes]